jgi:retinol-binding protein 3
MAHRLFVLNAATQTEILANLFQKLSTCYIFPDAAEEICRNLQFHIDAGEYIDIVEGEFFAYALTTHLQEVNHDEHLWVRFHPDPLPDDDGPFHQNQIWRDKQYREAKQNNFGIHKAEILPGNIGYLDIHYFSRPAWGGETIIESMKLLADTDALIIDLRKCLGGYPGMIQLLCSYLFGEEPIHLSSVYWRDEDLTQQYWTLPYIPGKHYIDKPVYLLISKTTFSAGEGFAYILKTRQRATILGEKTDGGSHATTSYRLHPHFEVSMPIGRMIDPLTEDDWEGTGIFPDKEMSPELAFDHAYKLARKK